MEAAADYIKRGKLVGFPTETVYGLGANALDAAATTLIFTTKDGYENAIKLIDIDSDSQRIYKHLTDIYWPGPLTLVVKANPALIPPTVTAGTGCIALELIKLSGVPIAAPSANKFGHVSPTKPQHVLNDFVNDDVLIIEGGACSFGIESTVAKLIREADNRFLLLILRKGGVSQESLQKTLAASPLAAEYVLKVESKAFVVPHVESPQQPQESPGLLLKHYSPRVDTFILTGEGKLEEPQKCILIDFMQTHVSHRPELAWYADLSPKGDVKEAINNIYEYLRLAEEKADVTRILLVNLKSPEVSAKPLLNKEHLEALYDRMFRAAAGRHSVE